MSTNYPDNLYVYYKNNPSSFEERVDKTKKTVNYAIIAVCVLLLIFPSIIPIGNLLVRIIAGGALLYYGFSVYAGGTDWYNTVSGGKIKTSAIVKFAATAESDIERIKQMFENGDFEGLVNEPDEQNRPLQLYIDEDPVGKTFYLLLRYYFSSSDFRGISDVKVVSEKQSPENYRIIKSIKSTS
jgi:hypothetical protein